MSAATPVCDTCGAPEATRIAEEALCVDCYAARSACCADEADPAPRQPPVPRPKPATPVADGTCNPPTRLRRGPTLP